jgi:hypothetical protein
MSTGTGMLIFGLLAALCVPDIMPNSKLAKDRGGAPWKLYGGEKSSNPLPLNSTVMPDLKPQDIKRYNFHLPLQDLKLIHCGLAKV